MTIERGQSWGRPGPLPADAVIARTDAEARAILETARRANEDPPPIGLLGGDLCRTLGGTGDARRLRSDAAMSFTVDAGAALVDGRLHWFVAHLVARRSWWRGRIVAVMNAEWHGDLDVAPRSHPNDGMLDVVDADVPIGERLQARRRLRTGTHVPHPRIRTHRTRSWHADFTPPLDVRLDGLRVGRAAHLAVRIEPDALTVVI